MIVISIGLQLMSNLDGNFICENEKIGGFQASRVECISVKRKAFLT